ncbi:MAG: hypothetical protein JNM03_07930 [Sphingopyxis sp.]|nr:hypothetical protein [Sphingopyxis sp.]MBL9069907.1 hypothetical protein [Sphingopyxis sp.]
MPRLWPDPRDDRPDGAPVWIWIIGGGLALAMLANVATGIGQALGW